MAVSSQNTVNRAVRVGLSARPHCRGGYGGAGLVSSVSSSRWVGVPSQTSHAGKSRTPRCQGDPRAWFSWDTWVHAPFSKALRGGTPHPAGWPRSRLGNSEPQGSQLIMSRFPHGGECRAASVIVTPFSSTAVAGSFLQIKSACKTAFQVGAGRGVPTTTYTLAHRGS